MRKLISSFPRLYSGSITRSACGPRTRRRQRGFVSDSLTFCTTAALWSVKVVGEHGYGKRRGAESAHRAELARYARGRVGDCVVAGYRAFSTQLLADTRLEDLKRFPLPTMLDLDVGKRQAALKRSGHLADLSSPQDPGRNLGGLIEVTGHDLKCGENDLRSM